MRMLLFISSLAIAISIGAYIACIVRRNSRAGNNRGKRVRAPEEEKSTRNETRTLPSDSEILVRLPKNYQNWFCNCSFEIGVFTSIVVQDIFENTLNGDAAKMDQFIEALIAVSDGVFKPAANIGDRFSFARMVSQNERPANTPVSEVLMRGLIRASNGELIIKAIVA